MRPSVGLRNLVSRLKQVVLPAPFGPINAWIVPRLTRRFTSRTATKPANSLVRPSVSRTMSLAIERAKFPSGSPVVASFAANVQGRRARLFSGGRSVRRAVATAEKLEQSRKIGNPASNGSSSERDIDLGGHALRALSTLRATVFDATVRPQQHEHRGGEIEHHAEHQGPCVTAARPARQTDQTRPKGADHTPDPGRQTQHHAEFDRLELALDDERRQGDEIADREPVDRAGDQQGAWVCRLRDNEQGGGLARH